jgi:hypothetical protein
MNAESKSTWVWHAADGSDFRTMHDFILISAPDGMTLFECVPSGPGRPVAELLAVCGFTGEAGPGVQVRASKVDNRGIILLRGFELEGEASADIEMEVRSALAGQLGGFFPVLAACSNYHSPAYLAFEYVWAAAGNPPISVRPPTLARGPRADKAPASPLLAGWSDPRYELSCTANGEQRPEVPESDSSGDER